MGGDDSSGSGSSNSASSTKRVTRCEYTLEHESKEHKWCMLPLREDHVLELLLTTFEENNYM